METLQLQQQIRALCIEKNAMIMAHYYCPYEVQDVADFVGDSLALAQQAQRIKADIIVLCGVHFMAETAAILCPHKRVLIPDITAGCSLAHSCLATDLKKWKLAHPNYTVVSYVNTSAAVKALSDVVVTSGNALRIVNKLPLDTPILFGPDKHLGAYINRQTGRKMELWDGECHVHSRFSVEALRQLKNNYPSAKVLAHPECSNDLLALSDVIGSTQVLLQYVQAQSATTTFIVATEPGVIHKMQQAQSHARFIPVPSSLGGCNECEYMRQNTLDKLLICLRDESPQVSVETSMTERARLPIERMLQWS